MKSEPNELPSPLEEILKEKYFQANTDAEVKEAANGLIGFVQLLFKADREIKAKEAAEAERHAKKQQKTRTASHNIKLMARRFYGDSTLMLVTLLACLESFHASSTPVALKCRF